MRLIPVDDEAKRMLQQLVGKINDLRAESKDESEELRGEVKAETKDIRAEFKDLRGKFKEVRAILAHHGLAHAAKPEAFRQLDRQNAADGRQRRVARVGQRTVCPGAFPDRRSRIRNEAR